MTATVEKWHAVIALLRSWGFEVVEVPHWETRGKGSLRVLGWIWHHTAGSEDGDAPSLRTVVNGRPDVRNALSNTFTSRSGVIYMVAAKVAWHAGRGLKGPNSQLGGNEAENTGLGEPWTREHYMAQVALGAAINAVFGAVPHWDHKEHAPGRKIDRTGIDPNLFRADVRGFSKTSTIAAPQPETEDDDTMKYGTKGRSVEHMQRLVNGVNYRSYAIGDFPKIPGTAVDGDYGPATADALAHAMGRATKYTGVILHGDPRIECTSSELAILGAAVTVLMNRMK